MSDDGFPNAKRIRKKLLTIIITSYNEEKTMGKVLDKVLDVPLSFEKEIIVVDGNSSDGTREILAQYQDTHPNIKVIFEEKREGKGAAIRKGFKAAKGDVLLIQDADLELDPSEYPNLLRPIEEGAADVVYGSRFKRGRGLTSIGSYIGNQTITWLVNILFFKLLTDIATCYKVFKKSAIENINLSCNGFDFDAEFTCQLLKNGKSIVEIPVDYVPRSREEGKKLNWTAGVTSIKIILKSRLS